jgi:hypothetical protein
VKIKFNLGNILKVAQFVAPLVKQVQRDMKGAKGIEKHEVAADAAMALLQAAEGFTDQDLADNALLRALVDDLIVTEKAALKARESLTALVADIRRKRIPA